MNLCSARQPNPMPMLPALACWRGWPRSPRPARRWRLAERFRAGRIDDRRRPAVTVLRRDGRDVHLVLHHQTLRPLTYAPQLRMAFEAPARQLQPPSRTRQTETVRTRTRLIRASGEPVESREADRGTAPRIPREFKPRSAPLAMVTTHRSGSASEPAIREIIESVTERVIRSHQRVESRQRTSVVVREQPRVAVEIERALTSISKRPAESSLGSSDTGMNWPMNNRFSTSNAPDLDYLTDQIVRRIDDRLTAQRERMGRF